MPGVQHFTDMIQVSILHELIHWAEHHAKREGRARMTRARPNRGYDTGAEFEIEAGLRTPPPKPAPKAEFIEV